MASAASTMDAKLWIAALRSTCEEIRSVRRPVFRSEFCVLVPPTAKGTKLWIAALRSTCEEIGQEGNPSGGQLFIQQFCVLVSPTVKDARLRVAALRSTCRIGRGGHFLLLWQRTGVSPAFLRPAPPCPVPRLPK